ncbi:MAG: serine/threonine-protein kinase [Mariprofundaceae bacterium]
MNRSALWQKDWFLGVSVTLLFLVIYTLGIGLFQSLEYTAYDAGVAASAKPAGSDIVILAIDDDSIDRIGRWPWSRAVMAQVIDKLSAAGSRIIGVDVYYSDPHVDPGLNALRQLIEKNPDPDAHARLKELDMDGLLVDAVKRAGNVLMPMFYEPGTPFGNPDTELPDYIDQMSIDAVTGQSPDGLGPLTSTKLRYPFPVLAENVVAMGHLNVQRDSDGVVRTEPIVIEHFNQFFPSMSLALAAQKLNLTMKDVRINLGQGIEIGRLTIGTDASSRMFPGFYQVDQDDQAFKHYSFYDLYADRIPAKIFKNKIVLIGATATGIGETFVTPVSSYTSGVELNAHVLQSILNEDFFTHPDWAGMVELLLIILVGIYLSVILPRLGVAMGGILSLSLLVSLIGVDIMMLISASVWVQTMTAAIMLLLGHVLLMTKHHFSSEEQKEKVSAASAETNKQLGLSFQSQGMLDMAFDKFRKCPVDDDVLSVLYNLGTDFERKRQFNKATAVFEYMAEHQSDYKDIQARIERGKNAGETMIFGGTAGGAMGTLLITGGAKPTLGRYEIIKELGKGAMGVVYLGKDPKINRDVAIKTMALAQEFEDDELVEVKERFFREAETAGSLTHPNIVTMYDAGEEHDLAYIAMEFLDGTDLSPYTKKGKLMPMSAALKVCGKVAEALHYAGLKNVVHRDIKPANIMFLKDKSVKVTDFGIARITSSSKTKTGVVLGTPSYMSPEQLSGKHVDSRSDIFSLGVMLYELLTGTRPFKGDSMATLMFQIANEPHPDIRQFRPELPESASKLIDKALAKDMDSRYQNGAEVIRDIIKCLSDIAAKGGKT